MGDVYNIVNMSSSMKDALIKAGVVSKEAIRKEEIENKGPQQKGVHEHHMKTYCRQCNKNAEDVEYYEHTNRSLKSPWLCLVCADKFNIHDDMRKTQQSPTARAGRFQRFYGPTKKFAPGQGLTAPSGIAQKPKPVPPSPNGKPGAATSAGGSATAGAGGKPDFNKKPQRKFALGSGPNMPGSRIPNKPIKK